MNFIEKLFNGDYMPHGQCLLWQPDLLMLHVGGDLAIGLAYFAIPLAVTRIVKKRDDLEFDRVFLMFAMFIFLCGVTHLIAVVNIWHGYYYLEGVTKIITALVSIATAIMVWRLLPKAIALPSRAQIMENYNLLQNAEQDLLEANRLLEVRVEQRTKELKKLTVTDPLTGIKNRRGLIDQLDTELARCRRYQHTVSALMVDLDNFKSINDKYGHATGDAVLIAAASVMEKLARSVDTVGRYGGEEFLIILPETALDGARHLGERLCESIAREPVNTTKGEIYFSCSIGVAEVDNTYDAAILLKAVDEAMYAAKHRGKNRVVAADQKT